MMRISFFIFLFFILIAAWGQDNISTTSFFRQDATAICNIPLKNITWVFVFAGQSNMAGRAIVEPQDTVIPEYL